MQARTTERQRTAALREELARAIEAEEYERAAAIRDEIKDHQEEPEEESS
jgi:protein-arginine kinase activator protein McsA